MNYLPLLECFSLSLLLQDPKLDTAQVLAAQDALPSRQHWFAILVGMFLAPGRFFLQAGRHLWEVWSLLYR